MARWNAASFYPLNSPISNVQATSSTDNTREREHELRSAVRVSRGPPVSLFHIMWHDDFFYNYSVRDLRFKTSSSRNHWFLEEEVHFWIFKNHSFSRFWTNEWFLKTENGLLPQEMSDFWKRKFWIAKTLLRPKNPLTITLFIEVQLFENSHFWVVTFVLLIKKKKKKKKWGYFYIIRYPIS